jgi:polyisoprenoid-binding protein YceI
VGAGTRPTIRLRRGLVVVAAGAGLLVLGGVTALLVSSHHAPAPLALSTPVAGNSFSSLAGSWKVTTGSEAGYRVKERFVNQPSTTEAVARTTKVAGSLVVTASGGALVARHIHFTVDLTALVSQDSYATYQVYQRDYFVKGIYLETARFPTADFTADSVRVPTDTTGTMSMSATGQLSVHGVTRQVMAQLQAQLNGDQVEIVGSINTDMRDFSIAPPDISFTTAEPQVVIEFRVLLIRS